MLLLMMFLPEWMTCPFHHTFLIMLHFQVLESLSLSSQPPFTFKQPSSSTIYPPLQIGGHVHNRNCLIASNLSLSLRIISMRSKTQNPMNLKLILFSFLFFFLLLVLLVKTNTSSSSKQFQPPIKENTHLSHQDHEDREDKDSERSASNCARSGSCKKIPPSLAYSLVHYVTTNITPQQTMKEIQVSMRVLEDKSPCNFLVFGLGHDSLMWASLNHGGRTVFLEEDKAWIAQVKSKLPNLEAHHVTYDTKRHQSDDLFEVGMGSEECKAVVDPRESKCQLAIRGFPSEIYEVEWDLIMVDAPTGYHDGAPGRMSAIYTAGLMARNRLGGETHVFVHDVDRAVEDSFSKGFLCEGYLKEQEGRIRHFTIPTHRSLLETPFCP